MMLFVYLTVAVLVALAIIGIIHYVRGFIACVNDPVCVEKLRDD